MKFAGIQSLRGGAALLVIFYHLTVLSEKDKYFGETLFGGYFNSGFRGVDLFFVISGFIMMHTKMANPNRTAMQFALNRASRIFIPYLPVFFLMTLMYLQMPSVAQGGIEINAKYFLQNIFLLPRQDLVTYVPVVAWTLTYELTFYFIFALTFISNIKGGSVAFGLWMAVCLVQAFTGNMLSDLMILDPLNLGFGIGIVSYHLAQRLPRQIMTPAFLASLVAFAGLLAFPYQREESAIYNIAILLCSGVLCATSLEIDKNVFSKVGDFSYSLYLLHYPILAVIFIVYFKLGLDGQGNQYVLGVLGIVVSLVSSWIYYRIFEREVHQKLMHRRAV